jgi:hypothetical protein
LSLNLYKLLLVKTKKGDKMKNFALKTTLTLATALLFSACSGGGSDVDFDMPTPGDGSGKDSFKIIKKSDSAFDIIWNKGYSGYSEIIYTDDTSKPRGIDYVFTNNAKGKYIMHCNKKNEEYYEVKFSCSREDLDIRKTITLETNKEYMWLASYGFEHEHGPVEYTMQYSNGTLSVH